MMNKKMQVGVLFGGRSGEHEVSLLSSRSVLSVISPEKYEITQIGITRDGKWMTGKNTIEAFENNSTEGLVPVTLLPEPGDNWLYLRETGKSSQALTLTPLKELDVILPILHGSYGEDGTIQGWLEITDIAYAGAGVLASAVAMDKSLFKDVMRTHRLPVVESITLSRQYIDDNLKEAIEHAESIASYPLFTKPTNLGSSVGITKCKNRAQLAEGLQLAAKFDRRVLVERGINAREIEISVLGNDEPQVSVPGEIVPCDEFYSYRAKYIANESKLIIPAPLSTDMLEHVRDLALRIYKAVDCAGMAREDFLLDKDTGEIYVNEINTIPGFTKISMYPKLWEASGLSYPELIDRLIELALERKAERDRIERSYDEMNTAGE